MGVWGLGTISPVPHFSPEFSLPLPFPLAMCYLNFDQEVNAVIVLVLTRAGCFREWSKGERRLASTVFQKQAIVMNAKRAS